MPLRPDTNTVSTVSSSIIGPTSCLKEYHGVLAANESIGPAPADQWVDGQYSKGQEGCYSRQACLRNLQRISSRSIGLL